jgi:hypothetical protein
VLGPAVVATLKQYAAQRLTPYMLGIYNLLGDPATRLAGLCGREAAAGAYSYEDWRYRSFTTAELESPAASGDLSDPDGDGLRNLAEYALGSDPKQPAAEGGRLGLSPAGPAPDPYDALVSFTRRKNAWDVLFHVEVAPDLQGPWQTGSPWADELDTADDGNALTETVRYMIRTPDPEHARGFARLRMTPVE